MKSINILFVILAIIALATSRVGRRSRDTCGDHKGCKAKCTMHRTNCEQAKGANCAGDFTTCLAGKPTIRRR